MSLRKRSGKWHYRFEFKGQEFTANTDLAATPQNMRAAGIIEAKVLEDLKRGKRPTPEIELVSFEEGAKKFLVWAKGEYRAHTNSFKRIKTSLSSALVRFKKISVNLIDAAKIDDYKSWRATVHEVKDITLRHDLHALSVFFQYAIRHHWAWSNPIEEVAIPSGADAERIHVLTEDEEDEYFHRAAQYLNLHDVGRLMINQGVRPEEATVLAKVDVDFELNTIQIRRGKSKAAKRTLDMTDGTREILERRMKGSSPWIFPSTKKPGCHIGRINSAHDSVVSKAAKEGVVIDWVPYDLRHTFATRVAETGIDIWTLAALLGHGSTRSVQKYVHPTTDHRKNAMKKYDRKIKQAKKKAKCKPKA